MAENLIIAPTNASKKEKYEILLPQIQSLIDGEPDLIANLANIVAAIQETFSFFWIGFYLVKEEQLVLGPFQGPVACTRINLGKGVCGTAWLQKKTIIVPNVDDFPGHIACSALSKSEIVLPVLRDGKVIMVLDVDSEKVSDFDKTDALYLERICTLASALPNTL